MVCFFLSNNKTLKYGAILVQLSIRGILMNQNYVWSTITREELLALYVDNQYIDRDIAEIFDVTMKQVSYKRKKLGITKELIIFNRMMKQGPPETLQELNTASKKAVCDMDLAVLSRVIAHYIFRNGPVEDMHCEGKLTDNDMAILNKYMNDRIATLIHLLREEDWIRLHLLFANDSHFGSGWDEPVLQVSELDAVSALNLDMIVKDFE